MKDQTDKKNMYYIIMLVMTLIIMLIGVTFALYGILKSAEKDSTKLYTGKIEINYKDGTYIKNPNLWPTTEPSFYVTSDKVYKNNFSVISSSTIDQTIDIKLNIKINEFSNDTLKYALYNYKGDKLNTGTIPNTGSITILSNNYLAKDAVADYTLIIWLDEKNYNQNNEQGKKIQATIEVNAQQIKY